jgi:para-nitrobenzyl esterase
VFADRHTTRTSGRSHKRPLAPAFPKATADKPRGDAAIPGVIDGRILTESIGTALAAGRFARVPILSGTNHDEERIFVTLLGQFGLAVSGGTFVPVLEPLTAGSYPRGSPPCWA